MFVSRAITFWGLFSCFLSTLNQQIKHIPPPESPAKVSFISLFSSCYLVQLLALLLLSIFTHSRESFSKTCNQMSSPHYDEDLLSSIVALSPPLDLATNNFYPVVSQPGTYNSASDNTITTNVHSWCSNHTPFSTTVSTNNSKPLSSAPKLPINAILIPTLIY